MGDEERRPLLASEPVDAVRGGRDHYQDLDEGPATSEASEGSSSTTKNQSLKQEFAVTTLINYTPPAYNSSNNKYWVTCRVCHFTIDVTAKRDQFVVKCPKCQEHTPMKPCPGGKKYVGCLCSCLLICRAASARIQCQREDCKRVLRIEDPPPQVSKRERRAGNVESLQGARPIPGVVMVVCAHCSDTFPFNTLHNALARCPHCGKMSSIGAEFGKRRGLKFGCFGLVMLAIALGVFFATFNHNDTRSGYYVLYTFLFVISAAFFWRALMYCTVKVSPIISTRFPNHSP